MDNVPNGSHARKKCPVYNRYNSETLSNWRDETVSLLCIEHRIQLAAIKSYYSGKIADFGTAFAEFYMS